MHPLGCGIGTRVIVILLVMMFMISRKCFNDVSIDFKNEFVNELCYS